MSRLPNITRRDFLNGVAFGVAAGFSMPGLNAFAAELNGAYYPPLKTGMRGSHPGSFEVAHAVAWAGRKYPVPKDLTDSVYDLIVVGGGISGLAAAHFYRQRADENAKVLVLDNHDDFGGHAKRNEFVVDGKTLIGYGGTQSIDGPGHYSKAAKQLLVDVGIDTQRFYDYFDQNFFAAHKLGRAIYFDASGYGRNVVAPHMFLSWSGQVADNIDAVVGQYPISGDAKQALLRLLADDSDHLPGLTRGQKIDFLRSMPYTTYLQNHVGMPKEVTDILRDTILGLWGVGWDALSGLEAYRSGMPGTQHLGVGKLDEPPDEHDEPYIFHFPDGGAGVARSLVRRLLPEAVPGSTMEDLVTSRIDYGLLDRSDASTRIRLNSTAVDIHHTPDLRQVDVTYVQEGNVRRVRANHVVFAGYNAMLPYICSEMPEQQREAIQYPEKVPLVYMTIAVRNWKPFAALGYNSFYIPKSRYMYAFGMDFPVSMGGYSFTNSPDQPTLIHGSWVPHSPDSGLPARKQHVAGRRKLYELTFEDFETDIVEKMSGALAAGGFDAERDIAAITVNRWPHGYAYEYNDLSDPEGFSPKNGPHVEGRAQIGRISIANSDASAYAYINGAVDAADRAVGEQLEVG
ncbi:MAG: NAD(P)/FAD-dependent oxidoreductase [Lysobacterales bacterium]|jgi:spermidine dehydrogenase